MQPSSAEIVSFFLFVGSAYDTHLDTFKMFENSFLFFFAGLACDILGKVTLDEDLSKPSVPFPPVLPLILIS